MRLFFEVCWRIIDRATFAAAYIVAIGFWAAFICIAVFIKESSWVEKVAEGFSGCFLFVIVWLIDVWAHKRPFKDDAPSTHEI